MIQHEISLVKATEYTTRYRDNPIPEMPLSETFSADSVRALLAHKDCQSFRIYLGRKADERICDILVAVDKDGNDILPPYIIAGAPKIDTGEDDGIILQDAFQCPPICPPPSPLNQ